MLKTMYLGITVLLNSIKVAPQHAWSLLFSQSPLSSSQLLALNETGLERASHQIFSFLGANNRAAAKPEAPCKLQFGGKSNMLQISCHGSSSCQATLHSSCPAGNFHL